MTDCALMSLSREISCWKTLGTLHQLEGPENLAAWSQAALKWDLKSPPWGPCSAGLLCPCRPAFSLPLSALFQGWISQGAPSSPCRLLEEFLLRCNWLVEQGPMLPLSCSGGCESEFLLCSLGKTDEKRSSLNSTRESWPKITTEVCGLTKCLPV